MQKLWQFLKKPEIFKYGVAAILLVVPLYPKFPIFNIPGTYVAVRAEDFLILAAFIFWFSHFLRSPKREFFKDKLNLAILIFLAVGLLSVASGVLLTKTILPHLGFLHWLRRAEYIFPLFFAMAAIGSDNRPKFFMETLLIAGLVAFLYGLGQIYARFPVISTQNPEYAKGVALFLIPGVRIHSTFAGHYDLAAFMVLLFPIGVAYLLALKNLRARVFTFFVLMLPAFWLFLKTGSRISFFAFLIGVPVTLWAIKKRFLILPFLALSIFSMFVFSDLGVRYRTTLEIYLQRVLNQQKLNFLLPAPVFAQEPNEGGEESAAPSEDRSTAIRLNIEWPRAMRAFAKNPILGTGYSSITLATDSDYLRLLGEVGIAGAVAFFLVLARLTGGFRSFLKNAAEHNMEVAFVGGFLGSLVGLLVNASFIDVFEASKVAIIFWTLAGIAVGIVRSKTHGQTF